MSLEVSGREECIEDITSDLAGLSYFDQMLSIGYQLTEDLSTDPTREYDNMVASVNKYGGFYIGRYEAGAQNEDGEKVARTSTGNGTSELVVKKGQYPYNYVSWGTSMTEYENEYKVSSSNYGHGAVYLSYDMYTNKEGYGVTSTLCYGVQWDAVLRFVRDEEHDLANSTVWGNHYTHQFNLTGAIETFKAKNIYDLAGNVNEWTMEVNEGTCRVLRGGNYNYEGDLFPVASRYGDSTTIIDSATGFRPTLYIK